MRLAVVAGPAEADRVAALLARSGVTVLTGVVDDVHREVARRHAVAPSDLRPPVHVGADLWFRLRQVAREADLHHADWAVTDLHVLPHLLGTWRYVVPDLRVVVVLPADGLPADGLPLAVSAYVRAHPDESVVLGAADLDDVDLRAVVAAGGGSTLPDVASVAAPAAPAADDVRAAEAELLHAEVQVLRARVGTDPASRATRGAADKPRRAAEPEPAPPAPAPAPDLAPDLAPDPAPDLARDDLVALLTWLGSARAATLVRADKRFRELRERYLGGRP